MLPKIVSKRQKSQCAYSLLLNKHCVENSKSVSECVTWFELLSCILEEVEIAADFKRREWRQIRLDLKQHKNGGGPVC